MEDITKLSKKELEQFAKIVADPALWCQVFLVNPKTNEPMRCNYVQTVLFKKMGVRTVIRVHRRAGKSFALMMYALWYAMTHKAAQIIVACPELRKVTTLFDYIDDFLRVSPLVKCDLVESTKAPPVRRFKNGSAIMGFTAGSKSDSKGDSLRGATADVVIVDEAALLKKDDWVAIEPIMEGDATRPEVISLVSSTPTSDRNRFWEICTRPDNDWVKIHIPVTENKDYSPERVGRIKKNISEYTYGQEWLAEFPDVGEGVFRRSYIDRAARNYSYYIPGRDPIPPGIRTMGVDWDKYQGSGPNMLILELDREHCLYRVIYHEEIEPNEYCLTAATTRIIELNRIFNPSYIYVDRGFGESQTEYLHLYGKQHPESYLAERVKGISFSSTIQIRDPATQEFSKQKIKPFMVNTVIKMLEDNQLIFSKYHTKLIEQLQDYKYERITDTNITFSSKNEHIIDALSLAAYAMFEHYANPFGFEEAKDSYLLEIPEVVETKEVPNAFGITAVNTPVYTRASIGQPSRAMVVGKRSRF